MTLHDMSLERSMNSLFSDSLHLLKCAGLLMYRLVLSPSFVVVAPRLSPTAALQESIARWLEDLGPAYVKVGQILSTRVNMLPAGMVERLQRLQDQVRPINHAKVIATIEQSLGRSLNEVFAVVCEAPVAAGSVSQVHRGVLHSGETVAIKVLRPGTRNHMKQAISASNRIVRLVACMPALDHIPLVEAFEDIADAMFAQCDFQREVRMNHRLQELFDRDAGVTVPHTYDGLCSDDVIVMQFIDELVKVTQQDQSRIIEDSVRAGFRALYRMVLGEGVIHCDFHPGNVFFTDNGRVVIIDTGFMEMFNERELFQFREFFIGIMLSDGNRCADILLETAACVPEDFNDQEFRKEIYTLVAGRSRVQADAFRVVTFARQLFSIQNAFRLRGSHRFTLAILSFMMYEGIACEFAPTIDFQREAVPILGPLLVRRSFYST